MILLNNSPLYVVNVRPLVIDGGSEELAQIGSGWK